MEKLTPEQFFQLLQDEEDMDEGESLPVIPPTLVYSSKHYDIFADTAKQRYTVVNRTYQIIEESYRILPQALIAAAALDEHIGNFYAEHPPSDSKVVPLKTVQ